MNNIKDLTDFYMWMVENDYDHNIRMRVEKKAEMYLKTLSQGQTLPIQIVVGSYNLKEGDKITLPSGLKCEVITVNAKVKDEYGHTYMLSDNEIE